eukprot:g63528.t1
MATCMVIKAMALKACPRVYGRILQYRMRHMRLARGSVLGLRRRALGVWSVRPALCRHTFSTGPAGPGGRRGWSPREREVAEALSRVQHAEKQQDLLYLQHVSQITEEDGVVNLSLQLDTAYRQNKQNIQESLQALSWVKRVNVKMAPAEQTSAATANQATGAGLKQVKRVVAVASCKGGVGKSTTAVNLAFALAAQRAGPDRAPLRVGILDADIFGPSLPTLIAGLARLPPPEQPTGPGLEPVRVAGLSCMSYGYLKGHNPSQAAALRGPIVARIIEGMIMQTNWGELDYLVVDMPPGTGDIQLTLAQRINFSGSVLVTTPQLLSFVDVVRGIDLFDRVKVPTVAVVENMSSFVCDCCGTLHFPFGKGHLQALTDQFGFKHVFRMPILPFLSQRSDAGEPFMTEAYIDAVADRDTPTGDKQQRHCQDTYLQLARAVLKEVELLADRTPPSIVYEGGEVKVTKADGSVFRLNARAMRLACSCALCRDEMTGESLLRPERVKADVRPNELHPRGNYAVAVVWSDGHNSSIYPWDKLEALSKANK